MIGCFRRQNGSADALQSKAKQNRSRKLKALLEAIVCSLVDEPEQIQVKEFGGESTTILELRVAPNDVGKVIGRQGATADAIRVLLRAASGKERRRYRLEIVDA